MPKDKKEHKMKKDVKEEEPKEVTKESDEESTHEEKQEKVEGLQRRPSCLDYDMDDFKKQHENQTIKDMTSEDILRYLRVIGKEQKNRDIIDGAEITLKKMNGEFRFRRNNRPPRYQGPPTQQITRPPQIMQQQYIPPAQRQFVAPQFGAPQYGRPIGQQFGQRPNQFRRNKPIEGPSNGFEGSDLV